MFLLKRLRLREQRRQPLKKFTQKAPQPPALKPPSTARTAGRSDWAERRFRRQPFILLSFSSSEKPQRSFQWVAAGTHATPAPNRAHSGSQGETGAFRVGALLLPSERFARFGNPARPGVRTAYFAAFKSWSRVLPKNAESLWDSDALMRVAVPRRRGPTGLRDPMAVSLTAPMGFAVLADRDYRVRKKAHFVLCTELLCQLCLHLPPLCCTL